MKSKWVKRVFIYFRSSIRKGIEHKNKHIGIKDIARHANVSIGPVDRVLHNRGGVSKETRERILKAIEELNYQPNILASRLKSTKQYSLAILVPRATDEIPFWHEHIVGVDQAEKEIRQFDVSTKLFFFDQNSETSFREKVDEIIADNIDGVFMVPVFYKDALRLLNSCQSRHIPCLLFDTNLPDLKEVSFIGQNAFDSGFLAGELLSHCLPEKGSILIVSIVQEHDNHLQFSKREEGFRTFFQQHKPQVCLHKFESRRGMTTEVEDLLLAELKDKTSISAIFGTNGIHHVAQVFEKHSIQTIKLLGYDIIPDTVHYLQKEYIHFLISQQPKTQVYEGIKLLYQNIILKQNLERNYYLPIDIVMKSNLKYYLK
ncbi:LacI family DNA-binding transcriptional regulator [Siphonobacter sp. SORGH_AS_1065]|uniref:LacI family DNA-binding transcriptional regulator n=1 Tax=Siphonobacter sp. SORGH_AS_1065 TaxID=3041795 RepID=UPI00278B5FC7|nr:LacI family DNA-binding transcriptional regulator [Siphonobacter sp. SORGH_AS_1065]MDQ1085500.1 LacI family transcriptional regulator [Siphonobacter sp. SORGH_AS_1065]